MFDSANYVCYNLIHTGGGNLDRTILHCDLNNFYASVECVQNPTLWDKPMAVTGNPRTRHGIILAKNNVAKAKGVKTAQTIWEAKKLCPDLICLPPQFNLYQEYSRRVREIYLRFTDQVESFGPDECWLDVTHSLRLFGTGEQIADKLRALVREETGLTISVGVSFNKYFAKLGSDLKKPDATTVISRENFKQKIWGLPADALIFIGKKTFAKLNKLNIYTIGDLAQSNVAMLEQQFGILGPQYQRVAAGLDDSTVEHINRLDEVKSVGNGMTAIRDLRTREEVETMIHTLAEKVTFRLRDAGLMGRTATLSLRDSELHTTSHSMTMSTSIDDAVQFALACMQIFNKFWANTSLSIRSVRISISNLSPVEQSQQLNLFDAEKIEKKKRLNHSLDAIRKKYGYYALRRAKTLDRDFINYFEVDEED